MDNVEFECAQSSNGWWSVTARSGEGAGWALRKSQDEAKDIATRRLGMRLRGEW